jgi:hypothetical protein
MLKCDLLALEDLWAKQGFFLWFFHDKNHEGRFTLRPTIEVVAFSTMKKDDVPKIDGCD